jgi:predicted phosphoribosyltransferase
LGVRFKDTREAGRALAARLDAYADREGAIVLALAHGGVGVGLEVSKRLGLPLDLLLLRRLLVTRGHEEPLCAASVAGARFLDEEVTTRSAVDPVLENFVASTLAEFEEHVAACRGERAVLDLKGRTVLLIDNGVRTGSTVRAAVRALRSSDPARVVVAAPVAAPESLASVETAADDFIRLATPTPFGHVGLWYEDFARPSDEQIRAMLDEGAGQNRKR